MRRREEDDEEERAARLEGAHLPHGVAREHRGVRGVVHLAEDGKDGASDPRVEHGEQGRLALEDALAYEPPKVELGDVDRAEAEVDARGRCPPRSR